MKPLETLDRARTEDGYELILYRRDGVYRIRVNGWELMSSRAHGSEDALARLAAEALDGMPAPRVLVGGLGMGFTLRAALRSFPAAAEIVVAEVFPAVVEWNRGVLGPLAGRPLEDPRVRLRRADVATVLDPAAYDAILLDVDNGPAAVSLESNERLYQPRGLDRLGRALAPGGILALWSASPEPAFERRLRRAAFRFECRRVPARGRAGGPRHAIYLAHPGGPRRAARRRPRRR